MKLIICLLVYTFFQSVRISGSLNIAPHVICNVEAKTKDDTMIIKQDSLTAERINGYQD
jgi:hypothetical protein